MSLFSGFLFLLYISDKSLSPGINREYSSDRDPKSSFVFPVYHFGLSIARKYFKPCFIPLSAIVPFAIVYAVLAHNFIKITTTKRVNKNQI